MDMIGLTLPDTNIVSIKASGPYKVVIKLKTVDSQFIPAVLNAQFVVPKHIWSSVSDAATFTNPNPVGSGPFAKVGRFTTQDYVFNKNPKYWLKGSPKIPCLEYVQASSNDAALLQIQKGDVDWTHNFVPNVAQAYIAKDKSHYHALLCDDGVSDLARLRHDRVPLQPCSVPQGAQPCDQPQRRLEAR